MSHTEIGKLLREHVPNVLNGPAKLCAGNNVQFENDPTVQRDERGNFLRILWLLSQCVSARTLGPVLFDSINYPTCAQTRTLWNLWWMTHGLLKSPQQAPRIHNLSKPERKCNKVNSISCSPDHLFSVSVSVKPKFPRSLWIISNFDWISKLNTRKKNWISFLLSLARNPLVPRIRFVFFEFWKQTKAKQEDWILLVVRWEEQTRNSNQIKILSPTLSSTREGQF